MLLKYTSEAIENLNKLKKQGDFKKLKKIKNALDKIETNPRHPGLHTHKYQSIQTSDGREIFQSYVENKTSSAYRIFWTYGPEQNMITILAITPHP